MSEITSLPLPWQADQWQRLQQQLERDQLPHALLFAGPPGVGKRRFAQALGHALLCLQPTAAGTACGHCRACQLLAAGTHPDWSWVAPEERGKAIKIDQIRALVDTVAQTAQQGGRKLAVLEPAEAMNRNAANALLKTLEEPPGAALVVLISDAPGRLLPTIRSRCQQLDFPSPPAAASRAWLQPLAADAEQLEAALVEAGERPLLARALLDGDGLNRRRQLATGLAAALAGRGSVSALAEKWQDEDWGELLEWLSGRLQQALRAAAQHERPGNDPLLAELGRIQPTGLFALLDSLQALLAHSRAGGNPNRQLALEALLLQFCDVVNKGGSVPG